MKKTWQESCNEVLNRRASNRQEWLFKETWSLITQKKCLKVAGIGFQHFQAFFSSYTFDGSVLEIFIS